MVYNSRAIPHLNIEEYNWWNECLHGVGRAGIATVFPQAIGMAAAFNDELLREAADVIADEARAKHHEAARKGDREIYKGLTFWTPTVNIFRDPRWGRGQETYGEDPTSPGSVLPLSKDYRVTIQSISSLQPAPSTLQYIAVREPAPQF